MPDNNLEVARDPKFPSYAYAKNPLVMVFKERADSTKKVAKLFMGEWMKVLDEPLPAAGRIHVRYRGGKGFVNREDMSRQRMLEVFFIDVAQGDAILIQTPDDRRILIDGGQSDDAYNFIRSKYNLKKAENFIDFEAIVATHSDEDHTKGLIKILKDKKIAVKRFYHNGLVRRKKGSPDPGPVVDKRVFGLVDEVSKEDQPELSPLMKDVFEAVHEAKKNLPEVVAKMEEQERWRGRVDVPEKFVFERLEAANEYLPPFEDPAKPLRLKVLWPAAQKVENKLSYRHYGAVGKTVNGNSIVLMLEHGDQNNPQRILLTGDLNTKSMDDMIKYYRDKGEDIEKILMARVYKAAHHGSQDFSLPFLKQVKPEAAVISSGDDKMNAHGHPRAVLLGTITRHSDIEKPAVFATELAACYRSLGWWKNKKMLKGQGQLYEKAIQGIVHLRSNGSQLYLGTVFGRKPPEDRHAGTLWKWDIWPGSD